MSGLFVDGEFASNAGVLLPFKIDCDALTDNDIATIAAALARLLVDEPFEWVEGIPRGGLRLAEAMRAHTTNGSGRLLIVDDVMTTGASMERFRASQATRPCIGAVIFARSNMPAWITPLFVEVQL